MQRSRRRTPVMDGRRSLLRPSMSGVFVYLMTAILLLPPLLNHPFPANAAEIAKRTFDPARAPRDARAANAAANASAATIDSLAWLGADAKDLFALLATTGIDPTRLLRGLLTTSRDGVGGPFRATGEGLTLDEEEVSAVVTRVRSTVPLASPVRDPHRLTSGFGSRRDPFRKRMGFHQGLDLAAPRGTPIYATAAGSVLRAGRDGAYGNLVELDHGNGVRTVYAHLHEYHVRLGQRVRAGERIGRMGRTGRATGVHLHYEVLVDGKAVDPRRFLRVGKMLLASAPSAGLDLSTP